MTSKSYAKQIGSALLAVTMCACAGAPSPSPQETSSTDLRVDAETEPGTARGVTPFPESLYLCPSVIISNPPSSTAAGRVKSYQPFVTVSGSRLAVAPVERACLSSGFGLRGEKLHKGLDLYDPDAVKIYAAANGRVKEKHYRGDYGNMLVIEHGDGIFARYAHLESFAADLSVGDQVMLGQAIGIMGNTASYQIPRHLHYEVLSGEWGTFSGAFGLTPVDIFAHVPEN